MANEVELIVGPAGSGKTDYVRGEYKAECSRRQAERRFGTALWITPTQRSRACVLRSLIDARLPVILSPQIVTFDEFAERLLHTAPGPVRPLSRIAKRKLLRDLINDVTRRGRLKHFAAVAGTAGFLELCVSFISELKREEIWPDEFERACSAAGGALETAGRRGRAKDRELALIYDAYQRRLHASDGAYDNGGVAAGLYDAEGRFWSARTLMNDGHRGPYRDLTLAVIDGFTDFTGTQYEMIAGLADWTERTLVTLPADAAGRREELFTKSSSAAAELRKALSGHNLRETRLDVAEPVRGTAFGHIASHLFENPRDVPTRSDATGLTVLSCVRESGELEAVAGQIKRMLVSGVPAEDIVVAFRSLEGTADHARRTFRAAGVPVVVDRGPAISANGSVRLLLSILELEREDWSFPRLLGILNSALFRPDWPGVLDGTAAKAVSSTLRRLNLDRGREVMLSALARRHEREESDLEPALGLALTTLRRVAEALATLREPASFADWVGRLLHLAVNLRIGPLEHGSFDSPEDRVAWSTFVRLVEEAGKADSLAQAPGTRLSLDEFRRQLLELLSGETWDRQESEEGKVRILAAEQIRGIDAPHLFFCGLSESVIPRSRGDDCLFGDAERFQLAERGIPLSNRARHSHEEMLLFYGCVTRARRSLTLSWPTVSDSGQPLFPSPYLNALLSLFDRSCVAEQRCGSLDPVPDRPVACVTSAELRIAATREALEGEGGLFSAVAARPEWESTARNIAAAAEMAAARFATRGLTRYEGLLSDPRNLKRLRQRFGPRHEFSATELETYAAHPYRFFLSCVLGLEAPVEPGPATDYARRGSAMHAALAALHHRLYEGGAGAPEETPLSNLLREALDGALSHGGDSPLHRALRRIEKEVLSKRADRYESQWNAYLSLLGSQWDSPPRPACFEVAFGNVPEEERRSPEVSHPVVEFGREDARVRVRGRIDRIDIGTVGGRPVFNVIDYKLTASPSRFTPDDVECGRSLQLALYAAAARRLGIVPGELFQLAFWSLNGKGFLCGMSSGSRSVQRVEAELAAALEEALDRVLPQLVESIRAGQFPVVADDPAEAYNPHHAAVARTSPLRAVADFLEKRLPAGGGERLAGTSPRT